MVLFQHKFKLSLSSSFYFSHDCCFFFFLLLLTRAITRLAPNQCNKNSFLLYPPPNAPPWNCHLWRLLLPTMLWSFSIQALLIYFAGVNLSDIFPYSFMQTKLTSLKIYKLFFLYSNSTNRNSLLSKLLSTLLSTLTKSRTATNRLIFYIQTKLQTEI